MTEKYIALSSVKWACQQSAVLIRHASERRITACSLDKPIACRSNGTYPVLYASDFKEVQEMRFCVDRADHVTGTKGCFLHIGDYCAISPVFDKVGDLYAWMMKNGWQSAARGDDFEIAVRIKATA